MAVLQSQSLATTFGDELTYFQQPWKIKKVFIVSVKEPWCYLLQDTVEKRFVVRKHNLGSCSNYYYYDEYPDWVSRWNEKKVAAQCSKQKWELSLPRATNIPFKSTILITRLKLGDFQRTFPLPLWPTASYKCAAPLTAEPRWLMRLQRTASTLLMQEKKLGQGDATDTIG
ncbi:hypothetical protein OH492_17530 [Vibrio chagasii]|nr:hypothetical protein [Vibrio chagasii]